MGSGDEEIRTLDLLHAMMNPNLGIGLQKLLKMI